MLKKYGLLFFLIGVCCSTVLANESDPNNTIKKYSYRQYQPYETYSTWSPYELVELYLEGDLSGVFIEGYDTHVANNRAPLNSFCNQDRLNMLLYPRALTWNWEVFIVRDYVIETLEKSECLAWVGVTYNLVAMYGIYKNVGRLSKNEWKEDVIFVVVNTKYGWRLIEPIPKPHPGIEWALRQTYADSSDVEYLKSFMD